MNQKSFLINSSKRMLIKNLKKSKTKYDQVVKNNSKKTEGEANKVGDANVNQAKKDYLRDAKKEFKDKFVEQMTNPTNDDKKIMNDLVDLAFGKILSLENLSPAQLFAAVMKEISILRNGFTAIASANPNLEQPDETQLPLDKEDLKTKADAVEGMAKEGKLKGEFNAGAFMDELETSGVTTIKDWVDFVKLKHEGEQSKKTESKESSKGLSVNELAQRLGTEQTLIERILVETIDLQKIGGKDKVTREKVEEILNREVSDQLVEEIRNALDNKDGRLELKTIAEILLKEQINDSDVNSAQIKELFAIVDDNKSPIQAWSKDLEKRLEMIAQILNPESTAQTDLSPEEVYQLILNLGNDEVLRDELNRHIALHLDQQKDLSPEKREQLKGDLEAFGELMISNVRKGLKNANLKGIAGIVKSASEEGKIPSKVQNKTLELRNANLAFKEIAGNLNKGSILNAAKNQYEADSVPITDQSRAEQHLNAILNKLEQPMFIAESDSIFDGDGFDEENLVNPRHDDSKVEFPKSGEIPAPSEQDTAVLNDQEIVPMEDPFEKEFGPLDQQDGVQLQTTEKPLQNEIQFQANQAAERFFKLFKKNCDIKNTEIFNSRNDDFKIRFDSDKRIIEIKHPLLEKTVIKRLDEVDSPEFGQLMAEELQRLCQK